jgi:hypothetical protein
MNHKPPIHLLLRFSDSLLKDKDTIEEHNNIVQRYGSVWFGKMGSPVSQANIDILNQQVEDGIPTHIYLVKGNRRKSTAFRSMMIYASKAYPKGEEYLLPQYYLDMALTKYMRFFVKLAEIKPLDFEDLAKIHVASSVLPLRETLIKSSTGHFFIVENKGIY